MTVAPAAPRGGLLQRKIGPVPVWALAIAAAGGAAYWYYRRNKAQQGSTDTTATAAPANDGTGTYDLGGGGSDGLGSTTTAGTTTAEPPGTVQPGGSDNPIPGTPGGGLLRAYYVFRPITNATAKALAKRGIALWTRDAQGHYHPVTKGERLARGTPEYERVLVRAEA